MRRGWVVAGALLVVVGVLLAYLPLSSTTSSSATVSPGEEVVFTVSSPLGTWGTKVDLFHPYIEVSIGWSSSAPVLLHIYPCGADANCANATNRAPVATGNATAGTLNFPAQSGVYYAILPSGEGAASTVTVQDIGPLAGGLPGMVLFALGVVVLLAGLAMRPAVPSEAEAEPESSEQDRAS